MSLPHHAVLLLAAGGSTRLGRPKQLVRVHGETLVRRTARMATQTDAAHVAIVVGAHGDAVFAEVADLNLQRVECERWADGLSASLQAGLAALAPDVAGALVLLCDQPALTTEHLQSLVQAWRADPARAVASAYSGVIGVPALLPRSWFGGLDELDGDRGARELLRSRADEVTAIDAPALAVDVDRPEDLPEPD